MKLLWGICGSFCNHPQILRILRQLKEEHSIEIQFVITDNCAKLDTRFGTSNELIEALEKISQKKVFTSLVQAETVGPYSDFDAFVIAPCTATCLGRIYHGIYDHSVALCAKAMLRNQKPVILAVASNDILSNSSVNLFGLLQRKNIYVVPFYQDDPVRKPNSCISEFSLIFDTLCMALKGKQIEPILYQKGQSK